MRLMALLPPDQAVVKAVAVRLRLSNAVRDRLTAAARAWAVVDLEMTDQAARAALYRQGRPAFKDAVVRRWAEAARADTEARRLLALADSWTAPRLPVGGRELALLGLEPGPETGRVLKAFEDGWIADDFPTEGHEARLKALITAPG